MIFYFRCRISPYFLNPKLRIIQTWPVQSMSDLLSTWLLKLLCSFWNHLYFFCQNRRGILCTILRIYCQEIKSVVNSISDREGNQNRAHIILRNYSQCAPSQLSVYFFFILRFLTISRKSALGWPCPNWLELRFSFSIAQQRSQHIQNNEITCAVLRVLEALFSPCTQSNLRSWLPPILSQTVK